MGSASRENQVGTRTLTPEASWGREPGGRPPTVSVGGGERKSHSSQLWGPTVIHGSTGAGSCVAPQWSELRLNIDPNCDSCLGAIIRAGRWQEQ